MLISDLNYLQSVGTSTVKGGGYYKKYVIDIDIKQKAQSESYVKAYKSDVAVDASATNKAYVSIEF